VKGGGGERGRGKREEKLIAILDVVAAQVEQIPRDFFHDNLSGNNFIKQIFKVFISLFPFPLALSYSQYLSLSLYPLSSTILFHPTSLATLFLLSSNSLLFFLYPSI
jgi:hypothetical protein